MTENVVHVWLIRADLPTPEINGLTSVLDDDERRRAARHHLDDHRRRFIAAHGVARVIIGHELGVPAERIGWRRGPHGKPELTGTPGDAQVNMSHSGEMAMLAMTEGRRCGIDLQLLPDATQAIRLARRFFPAEETRFVASGEQPADQVHRFGLLWTRKEACVKATGGRLMPGLRLPVRGGGVVRDPGGPLPGPYAVRDLAAPDRFMAAVALEGEMPYRVVRHWWPAEFDHDLPDESDMMAVEKCSTVTSG
ncbi:MAG TPA: 4'-phosphopantetheinyl transferase superfamily protein [Pseudonocardiaceae bacterium]|nr:4'-phosphopantetheinyl transferase superfamily protein [Pseudonocardiaceae bacterium]